VPNELYGKWFDETKGWEISEKGITNIDIEIDSIGNKIDTTYKTTGLSDSLQIYKAKELYVIHSKENSDYWEIIILKPMKNGDINTYYTSDPKIFDSDKNLKLEEAIFLIDDEEKSVKTLDPDFDKSSSFESALYSGQMKMKTLRKVITSNNLMHILKIDGSIITPADSIKGTNIERH
jgi:hypothetical protein